MSVRALLVLLFACSCMAQECPWMNAATAGDLLGGSVRVMVAKDACRFTLGLKSLRIQVNPVPAAGIQAYRSGCKGDAVPLRGLGNEAFACRVKAKHKTRMERVAGRVRKRAFVVDVSTDERQSRADLLQIAKQAAGQVAGDLF